MIKKPLSPNGERGLGREVKKNHRKSIEQLQDNLFSYQELHNLKLY
jgi:hypothetical protein